MLNTLLKRLHWKSGLIGIVVAASISLIGCNLLGFDEVSEFPTLEDLGTQSQKYVQDNGVIGNLGTGNGSQSSANEVYDKAMDELLAKLRGMQSSQNAKSDDAISKKIGTVAKNDSYGYAFSNDDDSFLSAEQKEVLAVVRPMIQQIKAAGGSDYDKEKAVHDYIVRNCRYDTEGYESSNMPDSDFKPYGVFVKHVAVCQGYAEAMKLCMDLLGIPCDLVTGSAQGIPHAWNVVCLDGEWYQVDVTWDDPIGMPDYYIGYDYFNITDMKMRRDHVYQSRYVCTATKYCLNDIERANYMSLSNYVTTENDFYQYMTSQVKAGNREIECYVATDENGYKKYCDLNRIDFSGVYGYVTLTPEYIMDGIILFTLTIQEG